MQAQVNEIRAKCAAVFAVAKQHWPHLDFSAVAVRFDLKGTSAGQAGRDRAGRYFMRFNGDMLTRDAFDHIINETVPHEIAHIVCFMDPNLGRDHNSGWVRVSQKLGCKGARCHTEETVKGKGRTYEFVTSRGRTVRIGDKHFRQLQVTGKLTWGYTTESVTKYCAYKIVGYQGRTLDVPIVRAGVEKPVLAGREPTLTPGMMDALQRARLQGHMEIIKKVIAAPVPAAPAFDRAQSKDSIAKAIMLAGASRQLAYDVIIHAIQHGTGLDRQLARAMYKQHAEKVGLPVR